MIYTLGYSGWDRDDLALAVEEIKGILIDCRWSPRSRVPEWTRSGFQKLLGDRYVHMPAFGNENYKGGPVKIHDMEKGIADVRACLDNGMPVVLMCACKTDDCHRFLVAHAIHKATGHPVKHLEPRWKKAKTQPKRNQLFLFS